MKYRPDHENIIAPGNFYYLFLCVHHALSAGAGLDTNMAEQPEAAPPCLYWETV
ncbi:hypothetical protein [Komagataeibacter xylinus]|uniref:hypothetical protein n=1 Tax=Komagataeibacter xylinus TaxID=28448 RepID=UPI0013EE5029|nr:hypothetical protein [Komagataeibacter xylinus]